MWYCVMKDSLSNPSSGQGVPSMGLRHGMALHGIQPIDQSFEDCQLYDEADL